MGGGVGGGANSIAIYKPRTAIVSVARGGRTAVLGICTVIPHTFVVPNNPRPEYSVRYNTIITTQRQQRTLKVHGKKIIR